MQYVADLKPGTTKQDLAKIIDPSLTFDYALPQLWVNQMAKKTGSTKGIIVSSFVWAYPKGMFMGIPVAITLDGINLLKQYEEGV